LEECGVIIESLVGIELVASMLVDQCRPAEKLDRYRQSDLTRNLKGIVSAYDV
jgi:hypothetical protein